jgi:hypothetical protein
MIQYLKIYEFKLIGFLNGKFQWISTKLTVMAFQFLIKTTFTFNGELLDPPNRLGREWSQGGFAKQRNLDEMNVQP